MSINFKSISYGTYYICTTKGIINVMFEPFNIIIELYTSKFSSDIQGDSKKSEKYSSISGFSHIYLNQ